jgi:hypothetical protein
MDSIFADELYSVRLCPMLFFEQSKVSGNHALCSMQVEYVIAK